MLRREKFPIFLFATFKKRVRGDFSERRKIRDDSFILTA
jgi:hypothetical protein